MIRQFQFDYQPILFGLLAIVAGSVAGITAVLFGNPIIIPGFIIGVTVLVITFNRPDLGTFDKRRRVCSFMGTGWKDFQSVVVVMYTERKLLEIVGTLRTPCCLAEITWKGETSWRKQRDERNSTRRPRSIIRLA